MIDKIRNYIERVFEDAPKTKKAYDLKEELIANLTEKYTDLISEGKGEEAAYSSVITGIGDLSELIDGLKEERPFLAPQTLEERKKNAMFTAIAVAGYILSPIPLFVSSEFNNPITGLCLTFVICALATALLVYNTMRKPGYSKNDDTLVEEFKEWKSAKSRKKETYRALMGSYWSLVTAIYFIINFTFHSWSYSWVIFIIAAAVQNILKAVMVIKEKDDE